MMLGVIVVLLIPGFDSGADVFPPWPWKLLHFFWIFAVLYVLAAPIERLCTRIFPRRRVLKELVEGGIEITVLAVMYLVFFETFIAAIAAAAVSAALYYASLPVVRAMDADDERRKRGES